MFVHIVVKLCLENTIIKYVFRSSLKHKKTEKEFTSETCKKAFTRSVICRNMLKREYCRIAEIVIKFMHEETISKHLQWQKGR